ncbi:MAG: hypothetical protein JWM44_2116 [Bacilli bacterium]|nr:hypothetical protein [Bacilli bacterium]
MNAFMTKGYVVAKIHVLGKVKKQVSLLLKEEQGDWLGNLAWLAIYGIGSIAVALALVVGLSALGVRINTSMTGITG